MEVGQKQSWRSGIKTSGAGGAWGGGVPASNCREDAEVKETGVEITTGKAT